MAGWDGDTTIMVLVDSIDVLGAGGMNEITENQGTLQMTAQVSAANASDTTITWSVREVSGKATISDGLARVVANKYQVDLSSLDKGYYILHISKTKKNAKIYHRNTKL